MRYRIDREELSEFLARQARLVERLPVEAEGGARAAPELAQRSRVLREHACPQTYPQNLSPNSPGASASWRAPKLKEPVCRSLLEAL
jgi:hypothetical protein